MKGVSMKWIQEFKAFAVKGNVVDMGVGIIIGAAFGKIVSSFVGDVIMPPIGLLIGGINFSDLAVTLKAAIAASGDKPAVAAVTLNYGRFIQTTVDFTIVAFAIFVVIKGINYLKRKEEAKPPEKQAVSEVSILYEIRDILKEKR
jgi:large conductance mechanosensitive channel